MKQSWWADYRAQKLLASALRQQLKEEKAAYSRAEKWASIYFGVALVFFFMVAGLLAMWVGHMAKMHAAF